jgi:hypothetical protein
MSVARRFKRSLQQRKALRNHDGKRIPEMYREEHKSAAAENEGMRIPGSYILTFLGGR